MKMPWHSRRMQVVFLLLVLLASVSGCSYQHGQTFSAGQGAGGTGAVQQSGESGHALGQAPAGQRLYGQKTQAPIRMARVQTAVIAVPEHYPALDPLGVDKREQELTPVERFSYEGLLQTRADQTYGTALAASFQTESRDGKAVVTVKLRDGLKWPNGQPVTVEDVRATLETYARPDYYGIWRSQMAQVVGASAFRAGNAAHISGIVTDAASQTVVIHLVREDRSFLPLLTAPVLARSELAGKQMPELEQLARAGRLSGAGPFQATSLDGADWTFAANEHYYAGKPKLQALHVRKLPPDRVQAAVAAGEVHMAWVAPEAGAKLAKHTPAHMQVLQEQAAGYHFLGYNLASGAIADLDVRRALAGALSVKAIAHDRFFGVGIGADGPLSPQSFAYKPQPQPVYQPKAAARILAEKGYSATHPLKLVIAYPKDPVRERLFQAMQEAWRPLPVALEGKALGADEFAAYVFGASPYDLYLFGWKDGPDPAALSRLWHSRERVGELGFNASHYHNAKADRLLDQADSFLPQAERKRLYGEWQKQFAADLPIVPLLRLPEFYVAAKSLRGIDAAAAHPFAHSWNWSLGE